MPMRPQKVHRQAEAEVRAGQGGQDARGHTAGFHCALPVRGEGDVSGRFAPCPPRFGRDGPDLDQHRRVPASEKGGGTRPALSSGFQSYQLGEAHGAQQRRGCNGGALHPRREGAGRFLFGEVQLGPGIPQAERSHARGLLQSQGQLRSRRHPGRIYPLCDRRTRLSLDFSLPTSISAISIIASPAAVSRVMSSP